MATIVNKLGGHITTEIPQIFDAVFECTLNMINKVGLLLACGQCRDTAQCPCGRNTVCRSCVKPGLGSGVAAAVWPRRTPDAAIEHWKLCVEGTFCCAIQRQATRGLWLCLRLRLNSGSTSLEVRIHWKLKDTKTRTTCGQIEVCMTCTLDALHRIPECFAFNCCCLFIFSQFKLPQQNAHSGR